MQRPRLSFLSHRPRVNPSHASSCSAVARILRRAKGATNGVGRCALVALLGVAPTSVIAQSVTGAGADATPVPKGSVRIRLTGQWDAYDRVFADSGSGRLLGGLATNALGTRALPQLTAAQTAIRSLSGLPTFALSLGTLEASGDVRTSVVPFALDVGITSWLSVGVVVPYVETRNNAQLILNRDGSSATVGQNPAYSTTLGASARAVNGTLLRQLAAARSQLSAEITRCANASAANCDAIRANPTSAQQTLTQMTETMSAVVTVYGDSLRGGAPVVPILGSSVNTAILTRLSSLRTTLQGYGITSFTEGLAPSAATVINGPGAIPRIAKDSAYGLNYTTLGGTRRAGIGDIDLTASVLWLNTLGARPAQWLNATRFGVRSQVTGGFRFGAAGADRTDDAFDVPIGDGANALLLRSTSDIVFNKWFWVSGTVRVVQPMSDHVVLRQPLLVDTALFIPSIVSGASRSLGRRTELEVAPRLSFGRFFGISGGYVIRHRDADRLTYDSAAAGAGSNAVTVSAQTYQGYLLGATFSTMASYTQGRSKWPIEVLVVHTEPRSGAGQAVAAVSTDRLELRIYTGFPRR